MAKEISEVLKKCAFCNKNVKKAKKYYRNGRYYCNTNCWRKGVEKAAADAAEAAGAAK
ncbi:MAG TPA: hypothetical protein VLJ10_04705 [Candidatus Bathyarchaeia archaeon]|nr:hypothetical protein [Candidatus Bathyarchaeia archaeon]